MKNIELQKLLKEFPDEMEVVVPGENASGDGANDLNVVTQAAIYRNVNEYFYYGLHELAPDDSIAEAVILLRAEEE